MSGEYWGFIIALCTVGIIYLVCDILREESRDNLPAYHWGEKQRHSSQCVIWARHDLLAAAVFLADFVILKTILPT